ncbi:flagellar hook-length control protein FliK [Vreelandella sp. V005]|uniref:flagellar hook-length control protein FliK n=1 Tax=Vreelandella sp. V005 TaxID=3459608 RepID=UPI0040447F27
MNIHQLLSASQSSPQTQPHGAFGRQDSPNGFFQKALSQASAAQRLPTSEISGPGSLKTPSQHTQLDELSGLLSAALGIDAEKLHTALESLSLDVSEGDLSQLLAQLQLTNSETPLDSLTLDNAQASTRLDEIAARLNLMASFSEDIPLAQPDSSLDPAVIDPAVLEAITQHLNINQTEAAQLVSTLNVVVSQQLPAHSLPADNARLFSTRSPSIGIQAASGAQPDNFFAQINTSAALSQISSDALMGALMTVEGAPKGGQLGEHLLTGFSLTNGSNPLASAQTVQGFAPSVTPTPTALPTPLTSPAWPQQLGQQLVQISQRGGEQHVQMQLNPAELGPLSISLKFGEQGAQAHFLSAHAQVRQVLEQAIPQLREALAEQGISLGETSVGEQRDPNAQAFAQSGGNRGSGMGDDSGGDGSEEKSALGAESSPLVIDGRVDLYA